MTASESCTVYGKYRLLDRIARGGMAEVFKAKAHGVEGFEKLLVIKRILPELSGSPRFVEMFINEAKIAVTLSHANIVQVFDLGQADGTYFIAMEYVAGYDLATVLRRGQRHGIPLPPELAVYIVSEVAKALDYAHRRRDADQRPLHIVHRDVSPQNILVSYEGEVKLTDFGIAKAKVSLEAGTDAGTLKGKYAYMAPEQADGAAMDGRSDLFSLGAVLYEAVSGVRAFEGKSPYETLRRVRDCEYTPLTEVAPAVSPELAGIVTRVLAKLPEDRHSAASSLYEELLQFLYGSGRRVGAHELSAYLDRLRSATSAARSRPDDAAIRLSFEHDTGADGRTGGELTPAATPHGRGTRQTREVSDPAGHEANAGLTPAAPQLEHRDVTVLAAIAPADDARGDGLLYTQLRRFGGHVVEQGESDGGRLVLALFGSRDPDGHDTEAAVRCALRVVRSAASDIVAGGATPLRLAVIPGRVLLDVTGELAEDVTYERLVRDAAALAVRAGPFEVLVAPSALPVLEGLFEVVPSSSGGDAVAVRAERDAVPRASRFVGRREELRRVGEILALANRGKRRVLSIVGDAGVGKSRFLTETHRRLRHGGHDVGMYIARIPRQGRDLPLMGCQELLRVILGIEERDDEPAVREKVGRLRELGLPAAELAAVAALGGVVSARSGSMPGGRRLRTALAHIATKLARDRLTVFAIDGVESMDDESLTLLDGLLRDVTTARFALVLSFRTGFVHPWRDLAEHFEIRLAPLGDDDLARLAAHRLGADQLPPRLLSDIAAKAGGNPLFVEEYVKALADAAAIEVVDGAVVYRPDVAEVGVPKTLRGIVASRITRLGTLERHLLQIAATAGPRFTPMLLVRVSGADAGSVAESLSVLEAGGVLVRSGAGDYAFTHDVVADVIREGLPIDARRELHAAIAAALETIFGARIDEIAERVAEHHRHAGDRKRAVALLVRATGRLEAEEAYSGAALCMARAIEWETQSPSPDRDQLFELYWRYGELALRARNVERGTERMSAAVELAEGLGREDYVARFSMLQGRLLVGANQFAMGRQWLDRAMAVARRLNHGALLRDVTLTTAEAEARNGQYANAARLLEEVLELARGAEDRTIEVRALVLLALAQAGLGTPERALETLARARTVGGSPDHYTECELLKTEAILHHYAGKHEQSARAAASAFELAKEYGFAYEAAANAHNLGEAYLRLGDSKRAFAALQSSFEIAKENGFTKLEKINARVLGFIDATVLQSEDGRQRIVDAVDYAQANGYFWDLVEGKYMLALADYRFGRIDEARTGLREVLRLSAEIGNALYEKAAQRSLGALEAGEPIELA